jgi:hypothetical protein
MERERCAILTISASDSCTELKHPFTADAMEFARRVAEHELDRAKERFTDSFIGGRLFEGQMFEVHLQASGQNVLIGLEDGEDDDHGRDSLWADVFWEAQQGHRLVVRLISSYPGMGGRCTAFCWIDQPDWVHIHPA